MRPRLLCRLTLAAAAAMLPDAVSAQQPPQDIVRVYPVPDGQAGEIAETLRVIHGAGKFVPTNDGKLLVRGPVEVHIYAARAFGRQQSERLPIAKIPLTKLPPERTAATVLAMFGKANRDDLFIEPCGLDNTLFVKGTSQQVREIQAAISVMEATAALLDHIKTTSGATDSARR